MIGTVQPSRVILGRCGLLVLATAALWAFLAWPAWRLAGSSGLEGLTVAAVLCCVPGWVVFFLTAQSKPGSTRAAAMVLVGTAVRLVVALAGALVVPALAPHLGWREFLVWLLVFYLATLALETSLVVRKPAK